MLCRSRSVRNCRRRCRRAGSSRKEFRLTGRWRKPPLLVDATGVGAGLAAFLADQRGRGPGKVIVSPLLFKRKTKSDLGWAFVGMIDGGRMTEYAEDGSEITRIYRHQLAACTHEVLPGPGKLLRSSVPASRGHDDLLISTAMTARLDETDWWDLTARGTGPTGDG